MSLAPVSLIPLLLAEQHVTYSTPMPGYEVREALLSRSFWMVILVTIKLRFRACCAASCPSAVVQAIARRRRRTCPGYVVGPAENEVAGVPELGGAKGAVSSAPCSRW